MDNKDFSLRADEEEIVSNYGGTCKDWKKDSHWIFGFLYSEMLTFPIFCKTTTWGGDYS